MAFRKGRADNYIDFLLSLHRFVTSANAVKDVAYYGLNTGDGHLSAEWADDSSSIVLDSWTLTYVEDSGGDYWTVTGASYGLQTAVCYTSDSVALTHFPYVSDNGEVGFKIMQGTIPWIDGDQITFDVEEGVGETAKWQTLRYNQVRFADVDYGSGGANAGNGTISQPSHDMYAPIETWTVHYNGSTWDVTGSISGAQAVATTGVLYDNEIITFTITAGTLAFALDDQIAFDVIQAREIYWMAPGNGGTEEIYMHIDTFENLEPAEDVMQWSFGGMTGYNPDLDYLAQPDVNLSPTDDNRRKAVCFQGREMPYWMVANGRRVMVFWENDSVYECMYLGYIIPYALPTEGVYPLAAGGTCAQKTVAVNSTDRRHKAFWDPVRESQTNLANTTLEIFNGSDWTLIGNMIYLSAAEGTSSAPHTSYGGMTWPFISMGGGNYNSHANDAWVFIFQEKTMDDGYPLWPIVPWTFSPKRVCFGELEGVFATAGQGANAEDVVQIGPSGALVDYILFPNVWETHKKSWCALRLE